MVEKNYVPFFEIEWFQYTKAFFNRPKSLVIFDKSQKWSEFGDCKTILRKKSWFFADFYKIVIFVWIFLL